MQENTRNFWHPIGYRLTAVNCDTVGFWFYLNTEYELSRRSQVAYDYVQVRHTVPYSATQCHTVPHSATVPHQYNKLLLGKLIQ